MKPRAWCWKDDICFGYICNKFTVRLKKPEGSN
jgi:hypothetical protein